MNYDEDRLSLHSELIAAILRRLLKNGLARVDLCSSDFFQTFASRGLDGEDFDDHFLDVMVWLRAEGIVRYSSEYPGTENENCISLCCLTSHALQLLDQKVDALNGMTGRQAIVESEKPGSPASSYVKAGSLLGGILGGFTKAIS